ncbi:PQQ-binding-like beta-propeller repeat protein [Candidatus Poriferisocius sp.]|uniref:outer membrane protein assembly factor BamB family protein n=1 Tax=Candidatus Poriferisocius sp. TaxID=3101276 RepID=UPI003B5B2CB1
MQPGDWEFESPQQEAELGGGRSQRVLIWATAVALLLVVGAGLVALAIWLTDSPDPPPASPDTEAPVAPTPTPSAPIAATPTVVAQPPGSGESSEFDEDEIPVGRINVTLGDGTKLFMRLPGISNDAEVSLWDSTQFVVGGIAVSVYFESCANRGYDSAYSNEVNQHLKVPDMSIVVLCEPHIDLPLSAVLFFGDSRLPGDLRLIDMRLMEVGSDLKLHLSDPRSTLGPLQVGDLVLFSPRFDQGDLSAFDAESGNRVWWRPVDDSMDLLAASDDTALAALWKDSVIAIDTANGEERWRASFGRYARVTSATATEEGDWLITYEYLNEGDPSPPGLARLDALGATQWTATGREGTDWSWDIPIVSDGRIFLRDVPAAWADAGRVSVSAFDTETGDLLWRTELNSTSEGYASDSLVISQDSGSFLVAALREEEQIVRLDATTGQIQWTGVKPPGRILSVRDSSIKIGNSPSGSRYDINPVNGLLRGFVR